MSYKFEIPFRLPSKKNSYQLRFLPSFWKRIKPIAEVFKRQGARAPYWIGPSQEVVDAETQIAWIAKVAIKKAMSGDLIVTILFKGKMDVDNAPGVILDGIEKSGRINNDRQVVEIRLKRVGPGKGCEVEIEEV